VSRDGDTIQVDVAARSFLHNQVRILVGTLQLVGRGSWKRDDVAAALAACDRSRAGPTAPPQGLTLMELRYDAPSGDGPSGACKTEDADVAGDDE
jgi:tRNA pseudouridine38-40 synthase